jgi:hypothetical protein
MNESNEPFCATKAVHMNWKVEKIAAAVDSIVGDSSSPERASCASDMMGGSFSTFTPQPVHKRRSTRGREE